MFWLWRGTDNKQTLKSEEKEYENIRYDTCVKRIFWKTELVGQRRLPETGDKQNRQVILGVKPKHLIGLI